MTRVSPESIDRAVAVLRAGGLVAFPTETVYGLGADAENADAVRRIFLVKGRPADHPLIVHLGHPRQLDDWARQIPEAARTLAAAFWPGPLTLVLRRSPRARDVVTGGLDTIGLRVPGHPIALDLLRAFGGAIAAPSANRFGRVSPTCAAHVREEFGDLVPVVLDGGPCVVGLESTILDLSGETPTILRPGGITAEQIEAVLLRPAAAPSAESPRVPGSLASHYAPQTPVELFSTAAALGARVAQLTAAGQRVAVVSATPVRPDPRVVAITLATDLAQCARQLYAALREVDRSGCDVAVVLVPAGQGLAVAIADRLRRAAGMAAEEDAT